MFKKFDRDAVASFAQVKSSEFRKIRNALIEEFPEIEEEIKEIFPKKTPMYIAKCPQHASLVVDQEGFAWFVNLRKDETYFPTLRTLHKFPDLLPKLQVDLGAIKFVLGGANVMCPGLTSPGGAMDDVEQGTICAIMAENKKHAIAIGSTLMSSDEIRSTNTGIAVEILHYLNDGLWKLPTIQ